MVRRSCVGDWYDDHHPRRRSHIRNDQDGRHKAAGNRPQGNRKGFRLSLLAKNATVWLDGARCKLADLAADDRAVVIYEKQGDRMVATSVRGLRKAQETRGTVNDVFDAKREITLKGTVKNSTYELQKGGTVWVDGHQGKLADIQPGDQVLITYEQRGDHYMATDVSLIKRK
jgi:hypothetical protein